MIPQHQHSVDSGCERMEVGLTQMNDSEFVHQSNLNSPVIFRISLTQVQIR